MLQQTTTTTIHHVPKENDHITEYIYSDRVTHCYNLAHMIPRSSLRQSCLHSHVRLVPFAAHSTRRQDYFGNQAYQFEIQRPHKELVITATSEVETSAQHAAINLDHMLDISSS